MWRRGSEQSQARYAAFSFQVGSRKWNSSTKAWETTAAASYWNEAVTLTSIGTSNPHVFNLSLFDTQYKGTTGSTPTVKSGRDDIVVAPGTGTSWWSPNGQPNTNPYGDYFYCEFKNNSEVAVEYKLEYDPGVFDNLYNAAGSFTDDQNPYASLIAYDSNWVGLGPGGAGGFIYHNNTYGLGGRTKGITTIQTKTLLPGETDALYLALGWDFDWYGQGPADAVDTALGKAAASGDIYIAPEFILTITQID